MLQSGPTSHVVPNVGRIGVARERSWDELYETETPPTNPIFQYYLGQRPPKHMSAWPESSA